MTVPKFTEKQLAQWEAEAEIKIYQFFQTQQTQLGLPALSAEQERKFLAGQEKCVAKIWDFFEQAGAINQQRLFNRAIFAALLTEPEITRYQVVGQQLAPFFVGAREEASQHEKMVFKNFNYYQELSSSAMNFFFDHLTRQEHLGFGMGAYQQWLASLKLGLYSAPERVLNGTSSLNYPDLNPKNNALGEAFSPRLEALKAYLQTIYELRVKVQLLELMIKHYTPLGKDRGIDLDHWTNFTTSIKNQLTKKFGEPKGTNLFSKIFGSANPPAPTNLEHFQEVQSEILNQVSTTLLAEQLGSTEKPANQGVNRNYAQEEQERERRARENQERKTAEEQTRIKQVAQESLEWKNVHSDFFLNSMLRKEWISRHFTSQQAKAWIDTGSSPKDAEFCAYLRDIKKLTAEEVLNFGDPRQLRKEFEEWKKEEWKKKKTPETLPERTPLEEFFQGLRNKPNVPPPPPFKDNLAERLRKLGQQVKDKPSPPRQAAQEELKGQRENIPPPQEFNFDKANLNEALNKLKGLFQEESQKNPPLPDLSLGINSIMTEEQQKLPWLAFAVDLDQRNDYPIFTVHNPDYLPYWEGEGEYLTLQLKIRKVKPDANFSDVLHNIFWIKNPQQKGFNKLVKDDALTEKDKLLIAGKREDDPRASKVGWKDWAWDGANDVLFGIPNVRQKSYRLTRMFRNQKNAYDLENTNHFIGVLRDKGVMSKEAGFGRAIKWGSAPKKSVLWITNQLEYPYEKRQDLSLDDIETINPNNGFSHYLLFSNLTTSEINSKYITNQTPALNVNNLAELVGKIQKEGEGVLVRLGPDTLELINSQEKEQKERSQNETKESRKESERKLSDEQLTEIGLTRAEFEALTTPYTDEAKIANLIKRISSNNPEKVAQVLNQLFETIQPQTRENIFKQMVNHNPVFNQSEKENLFQTWQQAKTTEDKKKVWETLTSHQAQREAFAKKTPEQKDKIFEEQVNQNPRYGPQGEDTQARRDRFKEYEQGDSAKKAHMEEQENQHFTTGENAHQWSNYFVDNANRSAGAGDETVGSTTDNNFDGQFSWTASLNNIYKLKALIGMAPEEMKQGMSANQPYWQVIMYHPLTYIFVFIGLMMGVLASATKKR